MSVRTVRSPIPEEEDKIILISCGERLHHVFHEEPELQGIRKAEARLSLQADLAFLRLATSFAEQSAVAFGLAEPEALALTLATEEIFAYLCGKAATGKEIHMRCRGCGYCAEQEFLFHAGDFDMRAFNLTASAAIEERAGMDETGLMIASRMVDRFQFFEDPRGLRLILTKDKSYPSLPDLGIPEAKPLETFSVRPPCPEELKVFVRMVTEHYASHVVPRSFQYPGKVVDMVACGAYFAAIASDEAGHLGGGIGWRWNGTRLVEFFGPYLFGQPLHSDMAHALIDDCIGAIARTRAIGLINRFPTPELPAEYFESLGHLTLLRSSGPALKLGSYFRLLEEDRGLSVWSHASLEPFLTQEYRRLVFAREIRLVSDDGESSSRYSVLSAELDRARGRAVLHPIWWGNDGPEILSAHVEALLKEGLPNIFFEMDLGKPWHCRFTPALRQAGFEPRLVLPFAGTGDLVVFQHTAGESST